NRAARQVSGNDGNARALAFAVASLGETPPGTWDRFFAEQDKTHLAPLVADVFSRAHLRIEVAVPALRTRLLSSLAQAAYEARELPLGYLDPDRLAILADALEDAGCDNVDILEHLRSPLPHVRGCWALDLLLGKQ